MFVNPSNAARRTGRAFVPVYEIRIAQFDLLFDVEQVMRPCPVSAIPKGCCIAGAGS